MPRAPARPTDLRDAFAVAPPGLEHLVARELVSLGFAEPKPIDGGVEFRTDRTGLYRANLHLRIASRVLVRLAAFRAISFAELEQRAKKVPWDSVITRGDAFQLRVTCRKSRLYHSGAVAQRLARDLQDRVGAIASSRASDDEEGSSGQLIVVRLDRDRCTISADTSGAHLHRRGYRTAVTGAPLRENLAAALVLASDWRPGMPLLDPFCGSGTIVIEAAMLAAGMAPGRNREFRLTQWPDHDATQWKRILSRARGNEQPPVKGLIAGSDRSMSALTAAVANAERAGVTSSVAFARHVAKDIEPSTGPGWIVSNPPYGVRLGDRAESRDLFREFADVVRSRFIGWQIGVLVGPDHASIPGLALTERFRTTNGGLPVRFMTGTVTPGPSDRGLTRGPSRRR